MDNPANTVHTEKIDYTPMAELSTYHQHLEEKYKNVDPEDIKVTSDADALMAFNGYYAMAHTPGAFFSVDTNIHIKKGSSTPIKDVALIISMDGTTSTRFPFTGTFDGTHLKQRTPGGLDIDLTFSRQDGNDGIVASFSGHITLPQQSKAEVTGSTYNNPIPYRMYIGKYYETEPIHLKSAKQEKAAIPVMQIEKDYKIMYDFGTNNGDLEAVRSFTYNLNMYFFSFSKGSQQSKLIMGTAAAGGFACNNMIIDGSKLTSRSLQTIPFPDKEPLKMPNLKSSDLAKFSGYYPLPSIASGAFISIQGEYETLIGSLDINEVMIGVSMDGETSKQYYFEEENMTFENGTLSMPEQSISITFSRVYNSQYKSLVTITGSIGGHTITAHTPFNPVPLSAFGGAPLTNAQNNKLTVVNDNEVIYNGTTMNSIIYVPIMYILAAPTTGTNTVMSFGSDGCKGTACIITNVAEKPPKVSTVYAIP
ncbi:MAG: hypothetical protein FH748_06045 [Balneolaceae bacterium]|nr:hypothetical protein [Balneolaceae bacterium]